MTIEFQSLDLRVRKVGDDISVEGIGPNGEWAEASTAFPDADELKSFMSPHSYIEIEQSESDRQKTIHLGNELGKALMPNPIMQLYESLYRRNLQSNRGIRIKLHFFDAAKEYEILPWELIRLKDLAVAMDPSQSIVRAIDLPEPSTPLDVKKTQYRVLVVSSLPLDLSYVPDEIETENIKDALTPLIDQGLIQLDILRNTTLSDLESALRGGGYHILHYLGHATIIEDNGVLFFADSREKSVSVDGYRLGEILNGTGVKMVFLNGGETAFGKKSGIGVAEALIKTGIPIAIAYKYVVTVSGAVSFARGFYNELTKTNSIELAVFSGRRSIAQNINNLPGEWANPVLFSRALDGKLWAGEAGIQIETFLKEGKLITEAKPQGEFNADIIANRILIAKESLNRIQTYASQLKGQQIIAEAEDAITTQETQQATLKLSEASTYIHMVLSNQEKEQEREQRDRRQRWIVLGVAAFLLLLVALLGFTLRDFWTPDMSVPVVGLPISIIIWSFIGGVAAMLQAFVDSKKTKPISINYEWLLWRPIVGMIMGCVVYLAISAGLVVLGSDDISNLSNARNQFFLWALAFMGGFSDKIYHSCIR